ncbi:hypothetical protein HDU79_009161 [Rhizoclosmatium sp. JEL0117]|nr:hypothetical protein HDU79_009161 [Rhizoclosmatium sp. JEL0117]
MIARVLAIALATAASFVAAIPGGGPATSSSSATTQVSTTVQPIPTVTVTVTQLFPMDCNTWVPPPQPQPTWAPAPSPAWKRAPYEAPEAPLSTQSSIPSTDPSYLSSLQWTPPQKSGYCQGNYMIPSVLLTGVIAVNANDDGSSNQTYLNNMACQWNLNGPRGYVGVLEFAYFDTECGWDFVFIYDGSTTQSPYTAKLCGNRTAAFGYNDLFVSSSNKFIVQFASDQAVVRKGFLAVFNFVPANILCQSDRDCNGAGSCLRGQCSCDSTHSGAFCQLSIANYTQFFSRELHSAVYDPTRDIMLVTSGHTLQQFSQLLNDVLIYNFTSKLWTQRQPPIGTMAPAERFCHTTFMMNGTMYLYGGVTNAEDSDMLWKYNIDQNTWNVIQTLGEYPPMFEGAAYVFVNNPGQPMLYVFGGYVPLAQSFELSRMLFVLDLTTFAWKILPNSPFPTWGPTGVYHKATNSLYFTGGYRFAESPIQPTLQYQIDSAMWYNNPSQPYELSMSYAQSFVSPQDSDTMIVWGGYPTTLKANSDNGIPCFSQQFQLYNLACQTWSYIDVPSDLFVRRKGHSLIVRKNQIVVYGGMNGYLLNDMTRFSKKLALLEDGQVYLGLDPVGRETPVWRVHPTHQAIVG